MNCPECNAALSPDQERCPHCGALAPDRPSLRVDQKVDSVQDGKVVGVDVGRANGGLAATVSQQVGRVERGGSVIGSIVNVFTGSQDVARDRRNRRTLLEKVRTFWIEGVLERSLHNGHLIELGAETAPEAVAQPWDGVIGPAAQPDAASPPAGRTLVDIFEAVDQALLILGAPGSGKTTALLELARAAIAVAEPALARSPDQAPSATLPPIPVLFNLSSWSQQTAIADWLVDELSLKYQIPKRIGRGWVANDDLMLLLDGLDEVAPEQRVACVAALDRFRQEHGLAPMAVCSRTQEYEALDTQLDLQGAIVLQPLTMDQIDGYLAAAGAALDGLRQALHQDETLQALGRSPLMLNVMSWAYQGKTVDELTQQGTDLASRRRHLFQVYVARMFARVARTQRQEYPQQQTIAWLSWLACHLSQSGQSLFLIEQMQPSWLSGRGMRWSYILLTRFLAGSILGLVATLLGLLVSIIRAPAPGYLLVGPLGGLLFGLVDGWRFARRRTRAAANGQGSRRLGAILSPLLSIALTMLAIYTLRWTLGILFGLKESLMFSAVFGLLMGYRNRGQSWSNDIRMVEALTWSPRRGLGGGLAGLVVGLVGGLIFGLVVWLTAGSAGLVRGTLIFALLFAPTLALVGGLFAGLQGKLIQTKIQPNQGIRLSARNALYVGLAVGIIAGLLEGANAALVHRFFGGWNVVVRTVPVTGLFWGVAVALWYGGLDLVKHYSLRLLLTLRGRIPRDYAHFLDYAVERIFLRRVGGGYLFVHRPLQAYFASLAPQAQEAVAANTPEESGPQTERRLGEGRERL